MNIFANLKENYNENGCVVDVIILFLITPLFVEQLQFGKYLF